MKEWFKLYSSCVLVNGAKENLIYDLERGDFFTIPHEINDVFKDVQNNDIDSLTSLYGKEILEFINQFIESEVGFLTDEPEVFPDISLRHSVPNVINNAIIELTSLDNYDYKNTINQIDELGCLGYQIRFLEAISINEVKKVLDCFKYTKSTFIEVIYPFNKKNDYSTFKNLFEIYSRLFVLKFFGTPDDIKLPNESDLHERMFFFNKNILNDTSEIISIENFIPKLSFFIESQKHNLGLNSKISITKEGKIKNYISHQKQYGSVDNINVSDVVKSKEFQKLWFVSNDKIKTCKDCQYRYSCISVSELDEIESGSYIKKEMCSFNPYANSWE